jgi:hypothetical protein
MNLLSVALLISAALQAPAAEQRPQLRLELQCQRPGVLLATIRNDGSVDTALIFGVVLANGAKYMVGNLRLFIKTEGQPEYVRLYQPTHYPAVIGGRVDDWVVPLPVGASYGLLLRVADFQGWRDLSTFPASTLSVRLPVTGPSAHASADAKLFHVWTEQDALTSNVVQMPGDCH